MDPDRVGGMGSIATQTGLEVDLIKTIKNDAAVAPKCANSKFLNCFKP